MKFLKLNTKDKEEPQSAAKMQASKKVARRSFVRPDPRVPLPANTDLEDYKFERVIGRGSFSLVYRAIEKSTDNEVVIKEYFPKHFSIRKDDNAIVPLDGKKIVHLQ